MPIPSDTGPLLMNLLDVYTVPNVFSGLANIALLINPKQPKYTCSHQKIELPITDCLDANEKADVSAKWQDLQRVERGRLLNFPQRKGFIDQKLAENPFGSGLAGLTQRL